MGQDNLGRDSIYSNFGCSVGSISGRGDVGNSGGDKMMWAWVTFEFEGWHAWKDAPGDVAFLRHQHRHIFKCRVWVEQRHNDRDVEYIQLKWLCEGYVAETIRETKDRGEVGSCEMIAENILARVKDEYPDRKLKVEVSEDGENGCLTESV